LDETLKIAKQYASENNLKFVDPFDDEKVIEGQATIAIEILEDFVEDLDFIFCSIGGGGLCAGIISYCSQIS